MRCSSAHRHGHASSRGLTARRHAAPFGRNIMDAASSCNPEDEQQRQADEDGRSFGLTHEDGSGNLKYSFSAAPAPAPTALAAASLQPVGDDSNNSSLALDPSAASAPFPSPPAPPTAALLPPWVPEPEVTLVTKLRVAPEQDPAAKQVFWNDFVFKCRLAWDVFFPHQQQVWRMWSNRGVYPPLRPWGGGAQGA